MKPKPTRLVVVSAGALLLLALLLLALSSSSGAPAAPDTIWIDSFDSPTLDPHWSWLDEDPTHWSLSARPGYLRITTTQQNNNLLVQPIAEGDFAIQTRVLFTPTQDFQQAGLEIYLDDTHYLVLVRAFCDLPLPDCMGDGIYMDVVEVENVRHYTHTLTMAAITYLKIERQSNVYRGYISPNGADWTLVGAPALGFIPSQMGLRADNSGQPAAEIPADFDYFYLKAPDPAPTVQVVGPWSGDQELAFEAVWIEFENATGVQVAYEPDPDPDRLLGCAGRGDCPDVGILEMTRQEPLRQLADEGALVDLNGLIDEELLRANYTDGWIDRGTIDGHLYGVWFDGGTKSLVWYDPAEFSWALPTTWADMMALSELISDTTGTAPWSVGAESGPASGWPLTDWFEEILLRSAGPEVYDELIRHEIPWTHPDVVAAATLFGQLFGNEGLQLDGKNGTLNTSFLDAIYPPFEDPPRAYLHRQALFALVLLQGNFPGIVPGTDVAAFRFPDIDPAYANAVLAPASPAMAFNDSTETVAFLNYLISEQAANEWILYGGGLSPNRNAERSLYPDPITEAAAGWMAEAAIPQSDLSDQLPGELNTYFWEKAMDLVTAAPDAEATYAVLEAMEAKARELEGTEIVLGVAADLSGPRDWMGWRQVNAAQLAVDQVNQAGGLALGSRSYTLTLVTADSGCDATQAISAAHQVLDAGAVAVLGHTCSVASIAAQELYAQAGVPLLNASATWPEVTDAGYDTTFRVNPRHDSPPRVMAEYLYRQLGLARVSVIDQAEIPEADAGDVFQQRFEELGGAISGRHLVSSEADFAAALAAIQAEQPEAIYYTDEDATRAGQLSLQATIQGMGQAVVAWSGLTEDRAVLEAYAASAGAAAEGDVAVMFNRNPDDMPGYANLNAAYQAAGFANYGEEAGTSGAFAYDAVRIMVDAIGRAGSYSSGEIRDAIAATIWFPGVVGTYQGFDSRGDAIPQWSWIESFHEGGWEPAAPTSAFSFQGELGYEGSPVNDVCDLSFKLYDQEGAGEPPAGGEQVGPTVALPNVEVIGGRFSVLLDFGYQPFQGPSRYLEIAVRCPAGAGEYSTLSPRQFLSPTPYAIYAFQAPWSGLLGVPAGFADGVDDTLGEPGEGLALSGNELSLEEGYRLPQECDAWQVPLLDPESGRWSCGTAVLEMLEGGDGLVDHSVEVDGQPAGGRGAVPPSGPPVVVRFSTLVKETEVVEYEDGEDPVLRKRPGSTKVTSDLELRCDRPCTDLWQWYQTVINGAVDRRPVSVIVRDGQGLEIERWNLTQCWPSGLGIDVSDGVDMPRPRFWLSCETLNLEGGPGQRGPAGPATMAVPLVAAEGSEGAGLPPAFSAPGTLQTEMGASTVVLGQDGLGMETDVIEYQDGSDPTLRKRPGRTHVSELQIVCLENCGYLSTWYAAVSSAGVVERSAVSLTYANQDGSPGQSWNLEACWPRKLSAVANREGSAVYPQFKLACELLEPGSWDW